MTARELSPAARFARVVVGGPLAGVLAGSLLALGAIVPGLILGIAALVLVTAEVVAIAPVWVRDRTPERRHLARLGWMLGAFACVELGAGMLMLWLWLGFGTPLTLLLPVVISLLAGTELAILSAGARREARLLGRIPSLLDPGEEPRAAAVRANGFAPMRSLAMLVATGERLLWVDASGARGVGYGEVEGFEADPARGELRLRLADGAELELGPVPRREMTTFRSLLATPAAR